MHKEGITRLSWGTTALDSTLTYYFESSTMGYPSRDQKPLLHRSTPEVRLYIGSLDQPRPGQGCLLLRKQRGPSVVEREHRAVCYGQLDVLHLPLCT